ncbi:hypothetical protein FBBNIHIM_04235 [Pseudocitrobacter vendiensis]|uniref:Uncharacterized protein n=1 Tax=Pseudocitrobacter vendiensis TaxID=2488306 RepID=A0ABM9F5K9_9ENTR|nr:hypothetical protein FBBNIHIM_04235 [Pseudocitrobacter vendiensis]
MTNFIAHNSVTRRYLKRGELMAKRFTSSSLRGADGKQTEGWRGSDPRLTFYGRVFITLSRSLFSNSEHHPQVAQ